MPYLLSRFLDAVNVQAVHLRVGRRHRAARVEAGSGSAARQGPVALRPGVREPSSSREKNWATTWCDSDSDWVATRLVAGGRGSDEPCAATVILLHGWLATGLHFRLYRWLALPLVRSGCEVWIPRLPFHGERTPAGNVSGELCLSADIGRTAWAIDRGVKEAMSLAAWLRARGRRRLGIWGVSLGGWIAALAATESSDWDGVALWEPVVDPLDVLESSPLARDIRAALATVGDDPRSAGEAVRRLVPLARDLGVPHERVLLCAARHDNVVSFDSLAELASRWRIAISWQPHGHISLVASLKARSSTCRFLASCLELERAVEAR